MQYYERSLTLEEAMRGHVLLVYGMNGEALPPPFERYLDNLTGCDWRLYRGNRGGHLIEGWWPQLFCEACFTPSRRDDPRLPYD